MLDSDPNELPPDVATWLGRLRLLMGVPFNYLVPDARMLPAESLRFFHLDFAWIDAMIDGAFSIGKATTTAAFEAAVNSASLTAAQLRAAWLDNQQPVDPPETVSGFLLRSQVVPGWPGMQMEGFSDMAGTTQLNLIRYETVAPSILFCLFAGTVARVDIHEPAEALHSGIEEPASNLQKGLRNLSDGTSIASRTIPVPVRSGDPRVIEIASLGSAMKANLSAHTFTSAEFGLEMIQGAQSVTFINPNS